MSNILTVENIILFVGTIISLLLIISGIILLIKNKKYSCSTVGKVINNTQSKAKDIDDKCVYYWHSLCEYNVDGIRCLRETDIGTIQPKYEIGQTVKIYYNPKNCHESYIVGDSNYKILGSILISLGSLAILLLLIFL